MENSMEGPQKIKNRTTTWSIDPTSGYLSKGNEINILKRYLLSQVHCIIHNSQHMEITYVCVDTWMDKEKENICVYNLPAWL